MEKAFGAANWQRKVNPGRVTYFAHSTSGEWEFPPGISLDMLVSCLTTLSQANDTSSLPYFRVLRPPSENVVFIDFLTVRTYFLDCLTLKVTPSENGVLHMHYFNCSSGLFPLSVPFATVLGSIFCFVPFLDQNQFTKRTMKALKQATDKALNVKTEMTFSRVVC